MSLPRMCSLPSSSGSTTSSSSSSTNELDKEKQRFAAAAATMAFPGLPFMAAAAAAFPTVTSTTTGSSVFPNQMAAQLSLFNPHLQQYYANFLHQQQLLQTLQNHSPQSRTELSPSVSDGRTSSHIDSPIRRSRITIIFLEQ
ncbi:Nonribosomal peptide synthetase [Dirofilaria immitis]